MSLKALTYVIGVMCLISWQPACAAENSAQTSDNGGNETKRGKPHSALNALTPLSREDLSQTSGGGSPTNLYLASNAATNTSTVTGNTIGNVGGTGTISGNSLTATSGFTTLISNSGNQVTIAQSTIVNVFLH